MSKKYLILTLISVVFIALLAGVSVWYSQRKQGENVRGKYAFAETRSNIRRLRHVKLTTADSGEINLYLKDGVWHFQEAANYFVNPEQLADFYYMLNNSIFTAVSKTHKDDYEQKLLLNPLESPKNSGTLIETFNEEEQLMDSVIIGSSDSQGEERFARVQKYPYVYKISAVRGFSGAAGAWMPYPLLGIPTFAVRNILVQNIKLSEKALAVYLPYSENLQKLMKIFTFLEYDGIAYKTDFARDYPAEEPKQISVETKEGLVYNFKIYRIENEDYWLAVELNKTKISQKGVDSFVAENQKYFKDWVFNLNDEQGQFLYETKAANIVDKYSK